MIDNFVVIVDYFRVVWFVNGELYVNGEWEKWIKSWKLIVGGCLGIVVIVINSIWIDIFVCIF